MADGDGGVRHPLTHDIAGEFALVTEVTDDFQVWNKKKNKKSIFMLEPDQLLRHRPSPPWS